MTTVGYSGKPLSQKLGIKPGTRVHVIGSPRNYEALLAEPSAEIVHGPPQEPAAFIHLFVESREELSEKAPPLVELLAPGGALWISWPKKSSKIATDVTENILREVLLPLGIVDVKVCAVDETWSGLKFLRRRK